MINGDWCARRAAAFRDVLWGPSLEGVRELWVRSNCLQLKACLVREIGYRKNFGFEKLMDFGFHLYRGDIDGFRRNSLFLLNIF